MTKPNFFIIGAPKCGTTSLYHYLIQHPQVYMSDPKEVHYLADDKKGLWVVNDDESYLDLFKNVEKEHHAIGEASVWYLYSKHAAKAIHNLNPEARCIVMLRNPVQMVHSMHAQQLFTFDDDIDNFEEAWLACPDRKSGKRIPTKCRVVENLFYDEIAKYAEQLQRYYDVFDESQIKVIFFDDFIMDIDAEFDAVLRFLNIDMQHDINLIRYNENKSHKNRQIGSIYESEPMRKLGRFVNEKLKFKPGILKYLKKKNIDVKSRDPLTETMKKTIQEQYREDIESLANMMNKDLSGWLR